MSNAADRNRQAFTFFSSSQRAYTGRTHKSQHHVVRPEYPGYSQHSHSAGRYPMCLPSSASLLLVTPRSPLSTSRSVRHLADGRCGRHLRKGRFQNVSADNTVSSVEALAEHVQGLLRRKRNRRGSDPRRCRYHFRHEVRIGMSVLVAYIVLTNLDLSDNLIVRSSIAQYRELRSLPQRMTPAGSPKVISFITIHYHQLPLTLPKLLALSIFMSSPLVGDG
jgi:hypothetical protein